MDARVLGASWDSVPDGHRVGLDFLGLFPPIQALVPQQPATLHQSTTQYERIRNMQTHTNTYKLYRLGES